VSPSSAPRRQTTPLTLSFLHLLRRGRPVKHVKGCEYKDHQPFTHFSYPAQLPLLNSPVKTSPLLFFAVPLLQLALSHLVAASPCDTASCKPPSCTCASVNPPGGITATDAPQFVTLTFDDAIQPASYQITLDLLNLKNPNGCPAKGTWFATVQYGDPSLAQQWYAAGNEVAAHTFNHIGDPSEGKKQS